VDVFGNRVRVAILRSLRKDGPASRAELAERLSLSSSLLQNHLGQLEKQGVLSTDPARSEPGRLRRRYIVDEVVVDALLKALVESLS
jgi:predicted ArsR family transcriptional regulator